MKMVVKKDWILQYLRISVKVEALVLAAVSPQSPQTEPSSVLVLRGVATGTAAAAE